MSHDLLTIQQVCELFEPAFGRAPNECTIYRWIKRGAFPAPCKLGFGRSRWRKSAVEAAIAQLTGGAA